MTWMALVKIFRAAHPVKFLPSAPRAQSRQLTCPGQELRFKAHDINSMVLSVQTLQQKTTLFGDPFEGVNFNMASHPQLGKTFGHGRSLVDQLVQLELLRGLWWKTSCSCMPLRPLSDLSKNVFWFSGSDPW